MPVDPTILAENAAQLDRLRSLAARFGDSNRDVGGGWTIGAALAHLAFWDRRAIRLLDHWRHHKTAASDRPDDDILNDALLDEWKLLTTRQASDLAEAAAQAINGVIERLDDATITAIVAGGDDWLLRRGRHRREHLDQIESGPSMEQPRAQDGKDP